MSTLIDERYGRRSTPARRLVLLLAAGIVLTLTLGFIVWITIVRRPAVSWQDLSFDIRSDSQIQLTFDVQFSGPTMAHARKVSTANLPIAICTVHALNQLQTEVGLQDVRVQAGPKGSARAVVVLDTSERAVTGQVKSCVLA